MPSSSASMSPLSFITSILKSLVLPALVLGGLPAFAQTPCQDEKCLSYDFVVPVSITPISPGGTALTVNSGNARFEAESTTGTFIDFKILNAFSPNAVNISTTRLGTTNGGDFLFQSMDDDYTTAITRMVIGRDGSVGIGTSTPARRLHVNGGFGMRLSPSTLPETPAAGDIVIDSTASNALKYHDGSTWITVSAGGGGSGSGSVTSVATGTGLTGGPITTSGTIAVDVGTTANKIVQLDSSAALPAVSGANLTSVNAVKINGASVTASASANGQVLQFNGTSWANHTLAVSDVSGLSTSLGNKLDAANMPASCAANQTLTFSSPTGTWACSNITITASIFGSQSAGAVLAAPASASGTPTFRRLTLADMPSGIGGGSSSWTEDSGNVYRVNGYLGLGTSTPGTKLDVVGALRLSSTATTPFITPMGTSVPTKIAIPSFDPSSYGQIVAMGISADGQGTARVLSLFDARPDVHQPTLTIFSPNENQIFGLSFDGSNTNSYLKSTVNLVLSSHGQDHIQMSPSKTIIPSDNVGIGTSTPGSKLEVAGTLRVDQICDRSGANCKTLSGGWLQGGTSKELAAEMSALKKQNVELQRRLDEQSKMFLTELKAIKAHLAKVEQKTK